MIFNIEKVDSLKEVAKDFMDKFSGNKIFVFTGEMGAGKTTFIASIFHILGIDSFQGSPTYSILNSYNSKVFGKINHFDFYRIKSDVEALDIGIDEILYSGDICFIEWPEKIRHLLPNNIIWSYIRVNEDNSRTLIVDI
ncbi:MAG: tRNA (adenosine(37)-N6)-threonylcarbamoyltransferase complex ATPase subunit type 1 TsaE [Crocinitomicaceae bacterium]|nr:tRNA (adenosine(37)-N6)-threonylcarbamoyltransferase complex ATPase subunit type 1 TsaE [Crocinitomicaceae bacterium]|tara:strand:+ start:55038 stop:55454 length:417 start_codon:yes stop_codon:yes gene_type:complete